ncbi:MAG: SdrD B-like domain-containing protein, partial [Candidatus Thorarchaeota archaeon]
MKKKAILALAISMAVFMVFSAGFTPFFETPMITVRPFETVNNIYTAAEAVIWTDRSDYLPGEIVPIYGSGFLPDSTIEVNVTRPDSSIDSDTAMSDETGYFVYDYDLDGIYGLYNVSATDGVVTAETSFFDGAEVLLGYSLPSGKWKESNLAPQKDYVECDWVPYQLLITSDSPAWNDITWGFEAGGSLDLGWTFWSASKDAIFVDMLGEFHYKFDATLLPTEDSGSINNFDLGFDTTTHTGWTKFTPDKLNRPGQVNPTTGLYDEVAETCDNPNKDHFIRFTPDVGDFPSPTDFVGKSNIIIYFQAHLALDALWRNGQESELPTELAGTLYLGPDGDQGTSDDWTCPHRGSSYAPGASTNFKLQHKTAGAKTVSIPIASYPTGKIEGYKFNDLNGNGAVVGEDEPVIPGWGINGTAEIQFMPGLSVTFTLEHLVTDENGYYNYSGIIEGNYTIEEETRTGWTHTGISISDVTGYDWIPEEGEVSFEIDTSGTVVRLDFYNTQFGKISGYKWHDLNGDGVWDVGIEPALDGWTIELRNATTNDIIATVETGAGAYDDGYYNFTHVLAGDYILTEVLQSGWINSRSPSPFTLDAGDDFTNMNFGNFMPGTLGGYKYEDLAGDGAVGINTGLEGWTINLWKWSETLSNWEYVTSTLTDGEGYYEFSNLEPGLYKINETFQDGWISTYPIPAEYEITVTSGFLDLGYDFYNFHTVNITVCKMEDLNGDGVGDSPIEGWEVHLTIDGAIVDTQYTGADGCYTWYNRGPLAPGSYYDVSETVPLDWTAMGDTSYVFGPPTSGEEYSHTFVNFENVNITVCKMEDTDGDGVGDVPIEGWEVHLTIDGAIVDTQYTGADG